MNIPKHTPGPWLRDRNTVYALMHHSWRKGIEQFRNRFSLYVQADKDCPDEEHEANIQLVLAAPELLAALQEVTQTLTWLAHGECRGFSDNLLTSDQAIEKARSAIAQATESKSC